MTNKVRINLPQFPAELITKEPLISYLQDKDFESIEIGKYNSNYTNFMNTGIKNIGRPVWGDFQQYITVPVGKLTARMAPITRKHD
jgi:hypothetical protein